jgi:hypothetical protein
MRPAGLLATLIRERWSLDDGASVVSDAITRNLDGDRPLIRVYPIASPAAPRGLGYTHREVRHRLTIDIRSRDLLMAEAAREEVLRILGAHRIAPFADDPRCYVQGLVWDVETDIYLRIHPPAPLSIMDPSYDLLVYDDGTYRGGGPGLSVWTIEVTITQNRRRVE